MDYPFPLLALEEPILKKTQTHLLGVLILKTQEAHDGHGLKKH